MVFLSFSGEHFSSLKNKLKSLTKKSNVRCKIESLRTLTRSLSTPRRCNKCFRMVYFRALRCKECGNILHESCAAHSTHWCQRERRNSHQPTASEETEKKCDTQMDPNSWRFMSLPDTTPISMENAFESEQSTDTLRYDEEETTLTPKFSFSNTAMTMTGLVKVAQWLAHRRKSKEISKANALDKHAKSRFGLLDEKLAQKQLKVYIKNTHKRASLSIANYQQSQAAAYRRTLFRHSQNRSFIISSSKTNKSSPGSVSFTSSDAQNPSDNELDNRIQMSESLKCKSIGKRTLNLRNKNKQKNQREAFKSKLPLLSRIDNEDIDLDSSGKFGRHYLMTKAKTFSLETKSIAVEQICATWPQMDTIVSNINDLLKEDEDRSEFDHIENLINATLKNQQSVIHSEIDVREILKEWSIPFNDLQFKERIRKGRHGDIFRGQWHGDVLIHTFKNCKESDSTNFWEDVAQLCLIRHENIMLFMGVCVNSPNLAVITNMCKGSSLYEQIHMKSQCLSINVKINIGRQIAQGMGYLHAKGIIHKRLNSTNVIVENSRVKICLMDQGIPKVEYDRSDYGCLPRGQLTYISPELMRSVQIEPPHLFPERDCTQESDVYAFGSLLYEILSERFPFHGMHSHTIIWLIGSGHLCDADKLKCNNTLKSLIIQCLSSDKNLRPKFSFIVRKLLDNIPLNRHHSSSEPERIDKAGLMSMSKAVCA